jgi:hypothetical protein
VVSLKSYYYFLQFVLNLWWLSYNFRLQPRMQ